MIKFLYKVGIFIIGVGILNIFLLLPVNKLYFSEYEDVKLGYENYMLADSHGSVLGSCLETAAIYNFSFQSDSYQDMYRKLAFLDRKTNIKKVFLTVDRHKLSKYSDDGNNERSIFFISLQDSISEPLNVIVEKYIKRYFVFVSSRSRGIYRNYFLKGHDTVKQQDLNRWKRLDKQKQVEESKIRIAKQFASQDISKKSLSNLIKIIKLCKIKNIELVGVKFPLSEMYIKELKDNNYGADKIFLENNLEIHDYSQVYKHKDEYFRDQDHLNTLGGEEFCELFFRDIQKNSEK
jgi:hypothetical protein